jgi:hypothetical protein
MNRLYIMLTMMVVVMVGAALFTAHEGLAQGLTGTTTGTTGTTMAQKPGEPAISFSPDVELLVAFPVPIEPHSVLTAVALIDKTHVLTAVAFSPDGELH